MRRGSTPTHIFHVNVDLTGATVYITYKQGKENVFEKTGEDVQIQALEDGTCNLVTKLTQEETLNLTDGNVRVQISYNLNGYIDKSNIMNFAAEEILKDEKI